MACIKGYDTITGKPCIDKFQKDKSSKSSAKIFAKGPHQFYQNMQGIGRGTRPPTLEEAVRTGDSKALIQNFDDTYRNVPVRKKGGSVIRGKSLRRCRKTK